MTKEENRKARRKRNKQRAKLRVKGLSEKEIFERIPIPGHSYVERLERVLARKMALDPGLD